MTVQKDYSYFIRGNRVGVLLIHGLGGTPVELKFVAQALNRGGHTVYCPLLVGHGESEEVLNSTKWIDWYTSVEEAHETLKQRSDVIIVGGLSAGVLLALHLAPGGDVLLVLTARSIRGSEAVLESVSPMLKEAELHAERTIVESWFDTEDGTLTSLNFLRIRSGRRSNVIRLDHDAASFEWQVKRALPVGSWRAAG